MVAQSGINIMDPIFRDLIGIVHEEVHKALHGLGFVPFFYVLLQTNHGDEGIGHTSVRL